MENINLENHTVEIDPTEIVLDIKRRNKNNYSEEEYLELASAIARKNYEIYAKERKNFSKEADDILEKIKTGHLPDKIEVFTLMCDEPEKVEKYMQMEQLKDRMKMGVISEEDFEYLIGVIGLDFETQNLLRQQFIEKGILVSDYPSFEREEEHIR